MAVVVFGLLLAVIQHLLLRSLFDSGIRINFSYDGSNSNGLGVALAFASTLRIYSFSERFLLDVCTIGSDNILLLCCLLTLLSSSTGRSLLISAQTVVRIHHNHSDSTAFKRIMGFPTTAVLSPISTFLFSFFFFYFSTTSLSVVVAGSNRPIWRRRRINLSNFLGNTPSIPAYERILPQPVFQVTTAWGSPYMLFEKYKDEEKALTELSSSKDGGGGGESSSSSSGADIANRFTRAQNKDDMQDTRPISLYFLDEHDARTLADEMRQMRHMKESDLRITCTSLGKAIRQASNLGNGLVTGQPMEDVSGKLLSMDAGGSLRHKIVPSKRELFYAARCAGRERVGCFGSSPVDDAELLLQPQDVIEANKMGLRRKAVKNAAVRIKKARQLEKEGLVESNEDRLRREYSHMEGQVGLPVFYAPGLIKKPPKIRTLLQGTKKAWSTASLTPLYFSYEDLLHDWSMMRSRSVSSANINNNKDMIIPMKSPQVEVFNMMDVVTSIDKDQWKAHRRAELDREMKGVWGKIPVLHHYLFKGKNTSVGAASGLDKIIFIPSSLGVQAKERIRANGNRKARLRPMRAWGKNA